MTTPAPVTTVCVKHVCTWSKWYDSTQPENGEDSGDYETFEKLRGEGYNVCKFPNAVQCRAKEYPDTEINHLNQTVECSQSRGLICNNKDQQSKQCYNYEIRISCCTYIPCSEIQTTTPISTEEVTTATAITSTIQTTIKPTTRQQGTETQQTEVPTEPTTGRESTTVTSQTTKTSQVSTTTYTTTTPLEETSTVVTTATTSPTTVVTVPEEETTTTTGTTVVTTTTARPTEGTTLVPTASTARTSPLLTEGEVIYNRTDMAGCNFYALCSKECEITRFQGLCPSPTPFTSVASETTTRAASSPTTATSLTTSAERNCTDVNPPRKAGESWVSECQKCVCDPATATVQCQPLCPTPQTPTCDLGFVPVPVLPLKDPCCPEFKCEPLPDTCVINGTMYKVGMSTVIDTCKNCTCSAEKDPVTKANIVRCEAVRCETSCPLLDEILPLDNCSHYKCEKIEDQFVAVQTKRVCPEYNPGECDPDEAETTPDGCCKICKPPNCKPYSKKTVIRQGDCESSEPVELAYCEGTCPGSSM
ncbi:PREDICTED: mucin-5B-like [Apaloderma vittatum]|uniref:mucin-5B-like n=1 Tax=Apaloderma vittatum TaxID=57397 RepID=UPI0005213522|nr:PREDICTED: mucin-5B-like [Apaloderma vittatum]